MKLERIINSLTALAHEKRFKLWQMLIRSGDEGMAAGSISMRLKIPATTTSFHLKQLSQAGLINKRRARTSIIYSADAKSMQELLEFLNSKCL